MRLHGTGLKINSDRTDIVSVADPTRVTFEPDWDPTVLMKKGELITDRVYKLYVSLHSSIIFADFTDNISKQDF